MARLAGVQVIGSASSSKQDIVRALGATPIDYKGNMLAQVRAIAPEGVAAVFDHVGGQTLVEGYKMLKRGGVIVSYGSLSTLNNRGHALLPYLPILGRVMMWNALPNGRRATFYDVQRWSQYFQQDLTHVLELLKNGHIASAVTREFPLSNASEALGLLAAGKISGKLVLVP
jgi:NADPH:quinone reductase-like Zn-dependent oxidoreductase